VPLHPRQLAQAILLAQEAQNSLQQTQEGAVPQAGGVGGRGGRKANVADVEHEEAGDMGRRRAHHHAAAQRRSRAPEGVCVRACVRASCVRACVCM